MNTVVHQLQTASIATSATALISRDGAPQAGQPSNRHRDKLLHSLRPLSQPSTGSVSETGMQRC
ncbi:hypothetical protein [Streptomyces sp. WG7]|uniref:hypothetical protein n=1 Tax=Streptomyces sp. WG7 TaxID=3417650 RepID=UPI003CEFC438